MSTAVVDGVNDIIEELQAVITRPCDPASLSADPGAFFPILRYILQKYTSAHQEAEAALALMALSRDGEEEDEDKGNEAGRNKDLEKLPRLFSLVPLPKFHWRFVTVNAKSLSSLLSIKPTGVGNYERNLELFDKVLDLDKYRFNRYMQLDIFNRSD